MKAPLVSINLLILLFILLTGCSDPSSINGEPEWVTILINEFKSKPVGNPPQSIWQYTYDNQIVYYVPPQCCDQFSTLYYKEGNEICAPDGGITGNGDGKCPDFFEKRANEKLIWQDERIRK